MGAPGDLGARFTSGAGITLLLIPAMMWVFQRVNRQCACLPEEIRYPDEPPSALLVAPPMLEWNTISEKALRFARQLSGDVVVEEPVHADRTIAVVTPHLVETRWYQYLLHNQTAELLRAALLLRGNRRMVVNVPWYFTDDEPETAGGAVASTAGARERRPQPG